jgi:DNA repair protein RadC
LTSLAGVGTARAVAVHAALELGRRMAGEERDEGIPVRCPRDVHEIFGQRLQDLPVENSMSRFSTRSTGSSATSQ